VPSKARHLRNHPLLHLTFLAGAMAAFHKTSKCGCYFKKYPLRYANLFTFTSGNHKKHKVILRLGITKAMALAEVGHGRPYKPAASRDINLFPDEVKGKFREGAVKTVTINAYERDRRARHPRRHSRIQFTGSLSALRMASQSFTAVRARSRALCCEPSPRTTTYSHATLEEDSPVRTDSSI
jgi:hypothetical protein